MNVQTTHEKSVRRYVLAITLFIVVISLCLVIFFINLFTNVEHAVEREILETMERQSNHMDFIFSVRFQSLEAAADFLGKQDDIQGEIAQQYIQSLSENTSMQRVAIYNPEGNAVFDDGEIVDAVDSDFFQLALQGQRNVSQPTKSPVDGVTRLYLSVPIRRGEEIVGVLSGSFDTDALGSLLFADSYDGQSVLFISNLNGQVVYSDTPSNTLGFKIPKELFAQLRLATFQDGESADELISSIQAQETGMAQYRQQAGYTLFLLYTPIADSELMLMHAIPRDVAYAELGFIQVSVVFLGIALFVCVALLVVFLYASTTHSQRNLVQFAQTDPLTDLFNKQHTEESIDLWLKDEACSGIQAMLFMDVDYFKQINDRFGHSVGDDALRFVGQALRQEFRSSDIIGRIGGDEFVVFMRNVPVKHAVRFHAASLRTRLKSAEIPGLEKGMLHCSIGISYAPEHGNTYHELTLCADKALYQTKARGRDGFTEYVDPLHPEQEETE